MHGRLIAAALALALLAGCRDKKADRQPPPQAGDQAPEAKAPEKAKEPEGEAAGEESTAAPRESVKTMPVVSIKRPKGKTPLAPRLVWTGSQYLVVWLEVNGPDTMTDDTLMSSSVPWAFEDGEGIEGWVAALDPGTGEAGPAVQLEGGAGTGPKKLSGPIFTRPVWHEGRLALAWALWNEEAVGGLPARYVVGAWTADGKAAVKAAAAGKSSGMGMKGLPSLSLVSSPSGLYLSWLVYGDKSAGCKFEHGVGDALKIVSLAADGSVKETTYGCAEVLVEMTAQRFGGGMLYGLRDDHIGSKDLFGCVPANPACDLGFYESMNPLTKMLATGGGLAAWHDELDEETFEVKRHCVLITVVEGGGDVPGDDCFRPKSHGLAWTGEGLAVRFESKKGDTVDLPFLPGDGIPLGLLKKSLAESFKADDALWGGASIAMAGLHGKNIKARIVGMDGLNTM
ncbi:MAG: hypothetical protein ABIJ56_12130 [Pseudomonadota bacterium]